jgi:cobalt-zinc-cadmium efflux system outer membrane protein
MFVAPASCRALAHPACASGLFVFIVLSSGCAAATSGARPVQSPSVAAEPAATPVAPSAPNDSASGLNAPVLERSAYVRAVLQRNPSLESARQGWRAALARVGQAGALDDPMLDLGVAPLSIGSSKAPFGYEVALSQRLPWFGKRGFEATAASAEAGAVKSDYQALRRDLALSALLLYEQYFFSARAVEINAHHVELMRVMRDAATAQFQSGRGSAQDPLQAEAELAHMEHDSARLASEQQVTVAQMNELLHRAPELPLPPPPRELSLIAPPALEASGRLEADALANRSEITAARQRAEAAQARADRAGRQSYPDFTVSTSYNSMWDMPEHRWMVGLGFNLPIQTGPRAAAADEALAMRAQFESEAVRLSDAARTQVFVALKQLQESDHVVGLFEKRLLPVARAQIDAARAGFVASQNPFFAVVEAEKNLRSVELDYQMARVDCDRHRAELERALGRIPGLDASEERP